MEAIESEKKFVEKTHWLYSQWANAIHNIESAIWLWIFHWDWKEKIKEVPDDDWLSMEDNHPASPWEYLVVDDWVVTTRWWNISDWNNRGKSITHWKPLPLPPKK